MLLRYHNFMSLFEILLYLFSHCKVVTGDGLAICSLSSALLSLVVWTYDLNLPELFGIPVYLSTKVDTHEEITLWKLIDTAKDSHGL